MEDGMIYVSCDKVNTTIDNAFVLGQKQALELACIFLNSTEIEIDRLFGKETRPLPKEYIDKFRLYMMKHIYENQSKR